MKSGRRTRLSEIGEDLLLDQLLRSLPTGRRVIRSAGDDVAIVAAPDRGELIVLKTDCVVERVHFTTNTAPEAIGWKAMMRTLSDYAAVSGVPEFGLITLIVRRNMEVSWVKRVYRGLTRAARRFQVSIVGGETSSTPGPATISVSVVGRVEKKRWVSRKGGKSGDDLFVTGSEAQVDFFYVGLWDDPEAGRRRRLYGFLMTLSHSRHQFLYPVLAEDGQAWQEGHATAFTFFGFHFYFTTMRFNNVITQT